MVYEKVYEDNMIQQNYVVSEIMLENILFLIYNKYMANTKERRIEYGYIRSTK